MYSDRRYIQSWLLWSLSACACSSFHQRYVGDKTVRREAHVVLWEVDGLSVQQKKGKEHSGWIFNIQLNHVQNFSSCLTENTVCCHYKESSLVI